MLALLIKLTLGRLNEFIDCQTAKVRIAVLHIVVVKTHWNSTMELLKCTYRLREITGEWLRHPKYCNYWPLFTTQNELTIVIYMIEVLRPFQYWILWMSKRHTITLHHVITVNNDMSDHMDGMMRAMV